MQINLEHYGSCDTDELRANNCFISVQSLYYLFIVYVFQKNSSRFYHLVEHIDLIRQGQY